MKNLRALLVNPAECQLIEGLFNKFRIGLNDWDKSKVFHVDGLDIVIYSVVCDEDVYGSIKDIIRDSRLGS